MQGDVWYFGGDTAQYDHGTVIGVEGAWTAGVDGANPKGVMEASSTVGGVYRQEFLLGTSRALRVNQRHDFWRC